MAQPTSTQSHLDQILTNISVAYLQNADNFIAGKVFPEVPVDKQSDKYYIFDKQAMLRDSMQLRAESTESAGGGYTLSRDSYFCDVFSLHKDISDRTRKNADNPLNPDRNATQFLTQQGLLRRELQFVSDYLKTGVWANDVTPAALWDNYSTSVPITDMETAKEAVLSATGFEANTLVLGYKVFRYLKHHPSIIDLLKYTSRDTVTTDILAKIFEVDRVMVAKAVQATNVEGETAAYSFVFSKSALLCYSAPEAGLEIPTAGYTYSWRGVSDDMGLTTGVSRFRMDHLKSDRVEIEMAWDNKVVGSDLGYFLNGCVS